MKTAELQGAALDRVVSYCVEWGKKFPILPPQVLPYSTDWAQGGPIIERERMDIECWDFHSMPWKATMWWDDEESAGDIQMYGPTPLIAAMRCYVASKLGDDIELPEELK